MKGMCLRITAVLAAVSWSAVALAQTARVGFLDIEGAIVEQPSPFAWLAGPDAPSTLRHLILTLDEVGERRDLEGLVIRLRDASFSTAQAEELGEAIKGIRSQGKRVHVFCDGYSTAGLLLASYADEGIAQAGSPVTLPGLVMEEMFLADTLAWVGIRADMVQIGDYKGAKEALANAAPSPEWDQNISGLLDAMYGRMRSTFKTGRGLSDAQLDNAYRELWFGSAEDAVAVGLLDAAVDLPTLDEHLARVYSKEIEFDTEIGASGSGFSLDMANPFAMFRMLMEEPRQSPKRNTIAVLYIDGPIMDGDSGAGGMMGGKTVGSRTIRNAIEDILEEDLIKGVVVRISSPGGSATASEIIWQGLQRLSAEKPVWVSVGSMAASGGYYILVGGSKVYVDPSSIVGSIGVVGGKLTLQGVYEKIKLNVVMRTRGPAAGMFRTDRVWTNAERDLVRARMQETYDLFTSRVTAGRPGIDLGKTAEGRLFVGHDAVGLKMADEVGGLSDAIAALAGEVGLSSYDVMDYPGPMSLQELIEQSFGGFLQSPPTAESALVRMAREIVGENLWEQFRDQLNAAMQLRAEPVLLTMPRVILLN